VKQHKDKDKQTLDNNELQTKLLYFSVKFLLQPYL